MDTSSDVNQEQDYYQTAPSADSKTEELLNAQTDISWTASEYIQHTKDAAWYVIALLAVIILAGLGYLLSRDVFTPVAVIVFGVILLAVSNRKPKTINYEVSTKGIAINGRQLPYSDFQSFSIIQEGPIESIMLIPLKRWSPAINLYFSPDDGQKIFDLLSNFLPFEEKEKDLIDKFLHKIRF